MSVTRDLADHEAGGELEVIPGTADGELVMCDPDHLGTRWIAFPEEMLVEVRRR